MLPRAPSFGEYYVDMPHVDGYGHNIWKHNRIKMTYFENQPSEGQKAVIQTHKNKVTILV
jgi:hypothetical protein